MKETVRKIIIKNENDTRVFGEELARNMKAGDVLALEGDLGTGKTTLTKYIARELGIMDAITSPTFTIINEYYGGKMPLYHFDVYRLNGIDEMLDLGYEEYFFGEGLCIVEWAEKIEKLLPDETKTIKIRYGETPDERIYICDF